MKRQTLEWEKIFANIVTDKRWVSKIYKQLVQHDIRKNKQTKKPQPNQKMGR